jgi:hypothetical protein
MHDDGWSDILWRLFEDLEPLVTEFERASGSKFETLQVKEKFGRLGIHVNYANDAIREPHRCSRRGILTHLRDLWSAWGIAGNWFDQDVVR